MHRNRSGVIAVSLLIASVGTALLYSWDSDRTQAAQKSAALNWARQISAQVLTLSLYAQEQNTSNPIAWAVKFLTSGPETRPMQMTTLDVDPSSQAIEKHILRPNQVFTYEKLIFPNQGKGIRVQIKMEYLGFLGTHSRWGNDFLLSFLLLTLFVSSLKLGKRFFVESSLTEPKRVEPEMVLSWVEQAQTQLILLGRDIKTVIQEAHALTRGPSRPQTSMLKDQTLHLSSSFAKTAQLVQDLRKRVDSIK